MSGAPLKLKAQDAEDVQVISAVLQDAIAPVCDMIYRADDKNFIMVVHRLRREVEDGPERICCAVNLSGIDAVQTQGIDLSNQEQILELLAIMPEGNAMQFIFAGNAKIKIEAKKWSMIVEDFGEAWPASCSPCHDEAIRA